MSIPPLEKWTVAAPPPEGSEAWKVANRSPTEWQVFLQNGRVEVRPFDKRNPEMVRLPFELIPVVLTAEPKTKPGSCFCNKSAVTKVADGWIKCVNMGEWGGRVDWFSPDGMRHYKISDDQIAAYAQTPQGLFAVEGLTHLGLSRGSLIKLEPNAASQWQARVMVDLKEAPYALLPEGNGTFLVATSTKLLRVRVSPPTITPLVEKAFWWGMYSNSLVAAPNGDLYLGMRGGVVCAIRNGGTYRLQWLTPPNKGAVK